MRLDASVAIAANGDDGLQPLELADIPPHRPKPFSFSPKLLGWCYALSLATHASVMISMAITPMQHSLAPWAGQPMTMPEGDRKPVRITFTMKTTDFATQAAQSQPGNRIATPSDTAPTDNQRTETNPTPPSPPEPAQTTEPAEPAEPSESQRPEPAPLPPGQRPDPPLPQPEPTTNADTEPEPEPKPAPEPQPTPDAQDGPADQDEPTPQEPTQTPEPQLPEPPPADEDEQDRPDEPADSDPATTQTEGDPQTVEQESNDEETQDTEQSQDPDTEPAEPVEPAEQTEDIDPSDNAPQTPPQTTPADQPTPPADQPAPDTTAPQEPAETDQPPGTVYNQDSVDRRITFRNMVRPKPPVISKRLGEEGTVRIRVQVDAQGNLVAHTILDEPGYPRLLKAAIQAMNQSTYRPAERDGQPVTSTRIIEYQF